MDATSLKNIPAIILAGGLGTRLRQVIADLPKPMAPVNGKPFLHYIFVYLQKQGIKKVVLAVGYKYGAIKNFFGDEYLNLNIQYAVEEEPLGTGGGIKQAFDFLDGDAFVINGDTFFNVELSELFNFYKSTGAHIALSLKELSNFDRYGTVSIESTHRIKSFHEKEKMQHGFINGGVYVMNKSVFEKTGAEKKLSFEKDVLEKYVNELNYFGKIFDAYFIDIGIPDDYLKAQDDFKKF